MANFSTKIESTEDGKGRYSYEVAVELELKTEAQVAKVMELLGQLREADWPGIGGA